MSLMKEYKGKFILKFHEIELMTKQKGAEIWYTAEIRSLYPIYSALRVVNNVILDILDQDI